MLMFSVLDHKVPDLPGNTPVIAAAVGVLLLVVAGVAVGLIFLKRRRRSGTCNIHMLLDHGH